MTALIRLLPSTDTILLSLMQRSAAPHLRFSCSLMVGSFHGPDKEGRSTFFHDGFQTPRAVLVNLRGHGVWNFKRKKSQIVQSPVHLLIYNF